MTAVLKRREQGLRTTLRLLASQERWLVYRLIGEMGRILEISSHTAKAYLEDLTLRRWALIGGFRSSEIGILPEGRAVLAREERETAGPTECFVCAGPVGARVPLVPLHQAELGGRPGSLLVYEVPLCDRHRSEPLANLEEMIRERAAQRDPAPSRGGSP